MAVESALNIPVAEAESAVGDLRSRHDPAARLGVPPHITLLYPFIHPTQVLTAIDALTRMFGAVPAFEFSLTETRRFPESVYLHPDTAASFVELTELIARRWPAWPPYGGLFSNVIPHLTVANHADTAVLDHVERVLKGQLPIRCRATVAWLLQSDEHGRWSQSHAFPLSDAT